MHRHSRLQSPDGFTMIELMIVVAILGILVSVATVSYSHFVIKAKAVEGESVVYEVERLEHLYHASNHAYTDSLADLGFAMIGTAKSYTPEVRMGSATDKINYQVRALPGTASGTDAWLLTNYRDGLSPDGPDPCDRSSGVCHRKVFGYGASDFQGGGHHRFWQWNSGQQRA